MRNARKPAIATPAAADATKYMIIAASAVVLLIVCICMFSLSSPTASGPPTIAPVVVAPYRGMVVPLASPDEQDYILRGDGTWIPPPPPPIAISVQENVTKSRGFGSVNQNTTGKPMFVLVSVAFPFNSFCILSAYTGRENPPEYIGGLSAVAARKEAWEEKALSFWVLDKHYYTVYGLGDKEVKLLRWIEWY